ncbi:MAG: transposase [Bacillota bacterium]|nr:transposase [Bacillota bacterium]
MPRQAREKSSTGIYHVMVRGINRQKVFIDDGDCIQFIKKIEEAKEKSDFEFYGYCLMGNHAHLLFREVTESLSLIMQKIFSRYVYWYNWKYDRFGHLFQERFKSEVVEDDSYLLTVLRYIHQNPVKAGIADSIDDYLWSSYPEYLGKSKLVDTSFVLKLFSADTQDAIIEFIKFMNLSNDDRCLDYKEIHRYSDEEILKAIEEKFGVKKDSFHLLEQTEMSKVLSYMKLIDGVTIRQLAEITGVSKYRVEKA